MSAEVLFDCRGKIGVITLNRPVALHALTLDMIKALSKKLKAWQEDDNIQAVMIMASSCKAFCAGGDVRWLYNNRNNKELQLEFFKYEYQLNQLIYHYKKPYIALMDGITMGGGVGIALHGSHKIVTENFSFAMPETAIGFFPDIGASFLLSRCPGSLGIYLGLTGDSINAYDSLYCGLVDAVVDVNCQSKLLNDLVDAKLQINPFAEVSAIISRYLKTNLNTDIKALRAKVDASFSFKSVEKIMLALNKSFDAEWAEKTINNLQAKSPMSLKVTLAQLSRAEAMTFDECIAMDLCLVREFMQGHDFYEGVRALLIDKDKSPKWQPQFLADIDDSEVRQYFADLI